MICVLHSLFSKVLLKLMTIVIFLNCLHKYVIQRAQWKTFLSLGKLFWSWTTFPQSIDVDIWMFVWPTCIALLLWMLDMNKLFDDWMNLGFVLQVPCLLYSSLLPLTFYSQPWIWIFLLCTGEIGRKEE
jgi:hypothetical protein